MSKIIDDLKYTKDHEWLKVLGTEEALCGITDHAQEMLTDIVFVELPSLQSEVEKKEQIAVVESVKAVSDVYSPVSGQIIEINRSLEENPEVLNSDPYEEGWIFKIKIKDLKELDDLMNPEEYSAYVEKEA